MSKKTSKSIKSSVQNADFSKTTSDRGFFVNWGLRRMNETANPYNGFSVAGGYEYVLDGTGVDVVIVDSGIQADHPEFQDEAGISRVVELDWYDESGITGSMPTGHYTDLDGHGTHVAGIVAGKTYGWAKNARIFAIKIDELKGSTDPNNGIPVADAFNMIKLWHIAKEQEIDTGFKRPTVVVTGWNEVESFTGIIDIGYQGTTIIDSAVRPELGMIGADLLGDGDLYTGVRVETIDDDIDELIAEGIHVITPAGNTSQKIDVVGGNDYDNYFTKSGVGTVFYHRGGSPYSENAITVANVDSELTLSVSEQKAVTSATGPGVDIFAPGTNIMSACSNTSDFNTGPYPGDDSYNILNLSGTSMAAAQVAGVIALYVQLNPNATPQIAKTWLLSNTVEDVLYETGNDSDYEDTRSLLGGDNRFAYNKFGASKKLNVGR